MTTIDPTSTTTAIADAVDFLRERVVGDVLVPGDEAYEAACSAWNLMFRHQPVVAVVAATTADVTEAVRFAHAAGLRVAVQATGHGVARAADGAVLIVTSRLTDVRVDPVQRTAYVSAGCKWGAVLAPAQEHGLAPLLGSTTDVGAIGYTLGGGMGWLARRYGLSSDSVRAFDLVTPDGVEVRASATEQPELFWALRGGGAGTLGVVTGMEIELHPVDMVYAGNLLYPVEMAREVLTRWRGWVADMDDKLTSSVTIMNYPPIPDVPEPLRGRSFVIVRGCWSGDLDEGQELIDEWREWRAPEFDMFGPMPFSQCDAISQDPVDPLPAMVTTEWFDMLTDRAIDVVVGATAPAGGPPMILFSEIRHAGGAMRRKAAGAVNGRGRSGEFLLEMVALVMDEPMGVAVAEHLRATRSALAPYVTGATYLNFTEGPEKQERTAEAFTEADLRRLRAVKADLDEADRFCHGLAVAPVAG